MVDIGDLTLINRQRLRVESTCVRLQIVQFSSKSFQHLFEPRVLVSLITDFAPVVKQAILLELNQFVSGLAHEPEAIMKRPGHEA